MRSARPTRVRHDLHPDRGRDQHLLPQPRPARRRAAATALPLADRPRAGDRRIRLPARAFRRPPLRQPDRAGHLRARTLAPVADDAAAGSRDARGEHRLAGSPAWRPIARLPPRRDRTTTGSASSRLALEERPAALDARGRGRPAAARRPRSGLARLEPIVAGPPPWRSTQTQLDQARAHADDADEEIRAMAARGDRAPLCAGRRPGSDLRSPAIPTDPNDIAMSSSRSGPAPAETRPRSLRPICSACTPATPSDAAGRSSCCRPPRPRPAA